MHSCWLKIDLPQGCGLPHRPYVSTSSAGSRDASDVKTFMRLPAQLLTNHSNNLLLFCAQLWLLPCISVMESWLGADKAQYGLKKSLSDLKVNVQSIPGAKASTARVATFMPP
mmetsp:Transcript_33707/g.75678  ORF Transcript_33707/g.75678 Transcript_33707/m.75678 type:complete len:113 (+) Transcript_33707:461-799(+)